MATILQQIINALTVGAIYALIALGYTMVYGVLRLINFAHSEMFTAGAFVAVFAAGLLGGVAGHPGIALPGGVLSLLGLGPPRGVGEAAGRPRVWGGGRAAAALAWAQGAATSCS